MKTNIITLSLLLLAGSLSAQELDFVKTLTAQTAPPAGCGYTQPSKLGLNNLIVSPEYYAGFPGGGPYTFTIPPKQGGYPVWQYADDGATVNPIWGWGAPYNWLDQTRSMGFNNPDFKQDDPPLYQKAPGGFEEQEFSAFVLSTALPTMNGCIALQIVQPIGITGRSYILGRKLLSTVYIRIPGKANCGPGQRINPETGLCENLTQVNPSSAATFCVGKPGAATGCVDGSGNVTSLIAGSNGPCANNLTQQTESIACPLINNNPPTYSSSTGGGGSIITWDPYPTIGPPAVGSGGCAPGDPNCPCYTNLFAPVPCSWVLGGVKGQTTQTNSTTQVFGPPVGFLDQEGMVVSANQGLGELGITGWVLCPGNCMGGTNTIQVWRDADAAAGEIAPMLVTTAAGLIGTSGTLRTDIQTQIYGDVQVMAFSIPASQFLLLPGNYQGTLQVLGCDTFQKCQPIGFTTVTGGSVNTPNQAQIGIAQIDMQTTNAGSPNMTQIVTIPLWDYNVAPGDTGYNDIYFDIQPPSQNGQLATKNTCYGYVSIANQLYGAFSVATGSVWLLNNAGTAWTSGPLNTILPSSGAGSVANGQCSILDAVYDGDGYGHTALTLTLAFGPPYAGKSAELYAYASDSIFGTYTDWQLSGVLQIGTASATTGPYINALNGANGTVPPAIDGSNYYLPDMAEVAITVQAQDNTGVPNTIYMWIGNNGLWGAGSCDIGFSVAGGIISLVNDAGTGNISGTIGAAGSISNSQCSVSLSDSTAYGDGVSTIVFAPAITFAATWPTTTVTNKREIWAYASDSNGAASGWTSVGVVALP